MVNYKVYVKRGADYWFNGEVEILDKDYYTTIKGEEDWTDSYIKYKAKKNLYIQIAKGEWHNVRMWKKIIVDNSDIKIERPAE